MRRPAPIRPPQLRRHLLAGGALGCLALAFGRGALAQGLDPLTTPTGGSVVGGAATISQEVGRTTVTQTSGRAIVEWDGFSVGRDATARFQQPGRDAVTLNRVTGGDLSEIHGRIEANGTVYLMNRSGVVFGEGAQVDVGGLVASTGDVGDADFMAGGPDRITGAPAGSSVVNAGRIEIGAGGVAVLAAPTVVNTGEVTARLGHVELAGTDRLTVDLDGDGLIAYDLGAVDEAQVRQAGRIVAEGGTVALSARSTDRVVERVIDMGGVVEARSVAQVGGRIILSGGETGAVRVTGTLDATGDGASERGGRIEVTGERVGILGTARVDASGSAGGGTVQVGGGWQGTGPLPHAERTALGRDATVRADATVAGDGGEVVLWSDAATAASGRISARGAGPTGRGGQVEISSRGRLAFDGLIDVAGPIASGKILFDPRDITIEQDGNADDNAEVADNLIEDEDSPTVDFQIDASALVNLAGDVTLAARRDIFVNAPLVFTAQNATSTFTLLAGNDIVVNAPISSGGFVTLTGDANFPLQALDGVGRVSVFAPIAGLSTVIFAPDIVIDAQVSAPSGFNIVVSNTIDVRANALLLGRTQYETIGGVTMFLGGTETPGTWHLSQAEIDRTSTDIFIAVNQVGEGSIVAQSVTLPGFLVDLFANGGLTLNDVTISGDAFLVGDNNGNASGTITLTGAASSFGGTAAHLIADDFAITAGFAATTGGAVGFARTNGTFTVSDSGQLSAAELAQVSGAAGLVLGARLLGYDSASNSLSTDFGGTINNTLVFDTPLALDPSVRTVLLAAPTQLDVRQTIEVSERLELLSNSVSISLSALVSGPEVTVTANAFDINASANVVAGNLLTVRGLSPTATLTLGAEVVGSLSLTQTELTRFAAPLITFDDFDSANVQGTVDLGPSFDDATFLIDGLIQIGGVLLSDGLLSLEATGGDIFVTGQVTGTDDLVLRAINGIIQTQGQISAANVTMTADGDVDLFGGSVTATGTFTINPDDNDAGGGDFFFGSGVQLTADIVDLNATRASAPAAPGVYSVSQTFVRGGTNTLTLGAGGIEASLLAFLQDSGTVTFGVGSQGGAPVGTLVVNGSFTAQPGAALTLQANDSIVIGAGASVVGSLAGSLTLRTRALELSGTVTNATSVVTDALTSNPGSLFDGGTALTIDQFSGPTVIALGSATAAPNTLALSAGFLAGLASRPIVQIGSTTAARTITVAGATTLPTQLVLNANTAGSSVAVNNLLTVGGLIINGSGATTTLSGTIETEGGDIIVNDAVIVSGTAVLNANLNGAAGSGTQVTITGSVNGSGADGGSLTIEAGIGAVDLQDAIGGTTPLGSLIVQSADTIALGPALVRTALSLTAQASSGSAITVDGDIEAIEPGASLEFDAPTTTFTVNATLLQVRGTTIVAAGAPDNQIALTGDGNSGTITFTGALVAETLSLNAGADRAQLSFPTPDTTAGTNPTVIVDGTENGGGGFLTVPIGDYQVQLAVTPTAFNQTGTTSLTLGDGRVLTWAWTSPAAPPTNPGDPPPVPGRLTSPALVVPRLQGGVFLGNQVTFSAIATTVFDGAVVLSNSTPTTINGYGLRLRRIVSDDGTDRTLRLNVGPDGLSLGSFDDADITVSGQLAGGLLGFSGSDTTDSLTFLDPQTLTASGAILNGAELAFNGGVTLNGLVELLGVGDATISFLGASTALVDGGAGTGALRLDSGGGSTVTLVAPNGAIDGVDVFTSDLLGGGGPVSLETVSDLSFTGGATLAISGDLILNGTLSITDGALTVSGVTLVDDLGPAIIFGSDSDISLRRGVGRSDVEAFSNLTVTTDRAVTLGGAPGAAIAADTNVTVEGAALIDGLALNGTLLANSLDFADATNSVAGTAQATDQIAVTQPLALTGTGTLEVTSGDLLLFADLTMASGSVTAVGGDLRVDGDRTVTGGSLSVTGGVVPQVAAGSLRLVGTQFGVGGVIAGLSSFRAENSRLLGDLTSDDPLVFSSLVLPGPSTVTLQTGGTLQVEGAAGFGGMGALTVAGGGATLVGVFTNLPLTIAGAVTMGGPVVLAGPFSSSFGALDVVNALTVGVGASLFVSGQLDLRLDPTVDGALVVDGTTNVFGTRSFAGTGFVSVNGPIVGQGAGANMALRGTVPLASITNTVVTVVDATLPGTLGPITNGSLIFTGTTVIDPDATTITVTGSNGSLEFQGTLTTNGTPPGNGTFVATGFTNGTVILGGTLAGLNLTVTGRPLTLNTLTFAGSTLLAQTGAVLAGTSVDLDGGQLTIQQGLTLQSAAATIVTGVGGNLSISGTVAIQGTAPTQVLTLDVDGGSPTIAGTITGFDRLDFVDLGPLTTSLTSTGVAFGFGGQPLRIGAAGLTISTGGRDIDLTGGLQSANATVYNLALNPGTGGRVLFAGGVTDVVPTVTGAARLSNVTFNTSAGFRSFTVNGAVSAAGTLTAVGTNQFVLNGPLVLTADTVIASSIALLQGAVSDVVGTDRTLTLQGANSTLNGLFKDVDLVGAGALLQTSTTVTLGDATDSLSVTAGTLRVFGTIDLAGGTLTIAPASLTEISGARQVVLGTGGAATFGPIATTATGAPHRLTVDAGGGSPVFAGTIANLTAFTLTNLGTLATNLTFQGVPTATLPTNLTVQGSRTISFDSATTNTQLITGLTGLGGVDAALTITGAPVVGLQGTFDDVDLTVTNTPSIDLTGALTLGDATDGVSLSTSAAIFLLDHAISLNGGSLTLAAPTRFAFADPGLLTKGGGTAGFAGGLEIRADAVLTDAFFQGLSLPVAAGVARYVGTGVDIDLTIQTSGLAAGLGGTFQTFDSVTFDLTGPLADDLSLIDVAQAIAVGTRPLPVTGSLLVSGNGGGFDLLGGVTGVGAGGFLALLGFDLRAQGTITNATLSTNGVGQPSVFQNILLRTGGQLLVGDDTTLAGLLDLGADGRADFDGAVTLTADTTFVFGGPAAVLDLGTDLSGATGAERLILQGGVRTSQIQDDGSGTIQNLAELRFDGGVTLDDSTDLSGVDADLITVAGPVLVVPGSPRQLAPDAPITVTGGARSTVAGTQATLTVTTPFDITFGGAVADLDLTLDGASGAVTLAGVGLAGATDRLTVFAAGIGLTGGLDLGGGTAVLEGTTVAIDPLTLVTLGGPTGSLRLEPGSFSPGAPVLQGLNGTETVQVNGAGGRFAMVGTADQLAGLVLNDIELGDDLFTDGVDVTFGGTTPLRLGADVSVNTAGGDVTVAQGIVGTLVGTQRTLTVQTGLGAQRLAGPLEDVAYDAGTEVTVTGPVTSLDGNVVLSFGGGSDLQAPVSLGGGRIDVRGALRLAADLNLQGGVANLLGLITVVGDRTLDLGGGQALIGSAAGSLTGTTADRFRLRVGGDDTQFTIAGPVGPLGRLIFEDLLVMGAAFGPTLSAPGTTTVEFRLLRAQAGSGIALMGARVEILDGVTGSTPAATLTVDAALAVLAGLVQSVRLDFAGDAHVNLPGGTTPLTLTGGGDAVQVGGDLNVYADVNLNGGRLLVDGTTRAEDGRVFTFGVPTAQLLLGGGSGPSLTGLTPDATITIDSDGGSPILNGLITGFRLLQLVDLGPLTTSLITDGVGLDLPSRLVLGADGLAIITGGGQLDLTGGVRTDAPGAPRFLLLDSGGGLMSLGGTVDGVTLSVVGDTTVATALTVTNGGILAVGGGTDLQADLTVGPDSAASFAGTVSIVGDRRVALLDDTGVLAFQGSQSIQGATGTEVLRADLAGGRLTLDGAATDLARFELTGVVLDGDLDLSGAAVPIELLDAVVLAVASNEVLTGAAPMILRGGVVSADPGVVRALTFNPGVATPGTVEFRGGMFRDAQVLVLQPAVIATGLTLAGGADRLTLLDVASLSGAVALNGGTLVFGDTLALTGDVSVTVGASTGRFVISGGVTGAPAAVLAVDYAGSPVQVEGDVAPTLLVRTPGRLVTDLDIAGRLDWAGPLLLGPAATRFGGGTGSLVDLTSGIASATPGALRTVTIDLPLGSALQVGGTIADVDVTFTGQGPSLTAETSLGSAQTRVFVQAPETRILAPLDVGAGRFTTGPAAVIATDRITLAGGTLELGRTTVQQALAIANSAAGGSLRLIGFAAPTGAASPLTIAGGPGLTVAISDVIAASQLASFVTTGALTLPNGLRTSGVNASFETLTLTGDLIAGGGARLTFTGPVLIAGTRIEGSGGLAFPGGIRSTVPGVVRLLTLVTDGELDLTNGLIDIDATVEGAVRLLGAVLQGGSRLTANDAVELAGDLTLNGRTAQFLSTVTLTGPRTARLGGGTLRFDAAGTSLRGVGGDAALTIIGGNTVFAGSVVGLPRLTFIDANSLSGRVSAGTVTFIGDDRVAITGDVELIDSDVLIDADADDDGIGVLELGARIVLTRSGIAPASPSAGVTPSREAIVVPGVPTDPVMPASTQIDIFASSIDMTTAMAALRADFIILTSVDPNATSGGGVGGLFEDEFVRGLVTGVFRLLVPTAFTLDGLGAAQTDAIGALDFRGGSTLSLVGANSFRSADLAAVGSVQVNGTFVASDGDLLVVGSDVSTGTGGRLQAAGDLLLAPTTGGAITLSDASGGGFRLTSGDFTRFAGARIVVGLPGGTNQVLLASGTTITVADPLEVNGGSSSVLGTLRGSGDASLLLNLSSVTFSGTLETQGDGITVTGTVTVPSGALATIDTTGGSRAPSAAGAPITLLQGANGPGSLALFGGAADQVLSALGLGTPFDRLTVQGGDLTIGSGLAGRDIGLTASGFIDGEDGDVLADLLFVDPSGTGARLVGSIAGDSTKRAASLVRGPVGDPDFTFNGCVIGTNCVTPAKPLMDDLAFVPVDDIVDDLIESIDDDGFFSDGDEERELGEEDDDGPDLLDAPWFRIDRERRATDGRDLPFPTWGNEELWDEPA